MDHFQLAGAEGDFEGFQDKYYSGRTPGSFYIPRFRNINAATLRSDFIRGYGFQGKGIRENWESKMNTAEGFGSDFKKELTTPGLWKIWLGGWGETLPYQDNRIVLSQTEKDKWGLPLISVNFEYHQNEKAMKEDIKTAACEMLEETGFMNIHSFSYDKPRGVRSTRNGNRPHGKRPEDLRTKRLQSNARR